MPLKSSAVALFILGSTCTFPAIGDDFGEDPFMEDFPVILSVTRLPQKTNEVPASVTVIDREMIDASGATEIAELFRLVPGFQVGHYVATDGQRTSVSYHGNSDQYARRMQVLVDGRSVYLPSTGGVSWDDLPIGMNEIERIEVIRGSNGVTYGVNSFQAVINIITLHSEATHGNEYSLISAGQNENLVGIRTGGNSGALNYRLNLQYETSNGFDESVEFQEDLNDDNSTLKLNIRTDYQIGINDSLNVSMGYTSGTREGGYNATGLSAQKNALNPLIDPVHDHQVTSSYQDIKYQHIISSDQEINLQLYHNVHDLRNRFRTAGDLTGVIGVAFLDRDLSLFDERLGVELSHQFRLGNSIRTVWGGELRQDRFRGNDWVGTDAIFSNNTQRLFFNGEWTPAADWTVNIGDMVEESDYMSMQHSPRIAVNWDMAKYHYIRMARSRAWRSPTFIENEFDYKVGPIQLFLNSEQLRPERIDVSEVAFGGGRRSTGVEYELRLFQEDISDILAIPKPGAVFIVTNDGDSHVRGSELALTLYPTQPGSKLRIGYSKLTPTGNIKTRYTPEDIANLVPEETLDLLYSQKIGEGGLLGINIYHVGPMKFSAGDTNEGFTTANISYHHPVTLYSYKTKVSISAQDIFGSYFDFEKQTVTKPQFYVGLKGDF